MGKYLKKFENYSDYEEYINDNPFLPNVSYCNDENDVYFNKLTTSLVKEINITKFEYTPYPTPSTGGTSEPFLTYEIVFYDGHIETEGAKLEYNMESGEALIDDDGVISWDENTTSDIRECEVVVTVLKDRKTATASFTHRQEAPVKEISAVTINKVVYDPKEITYEGGYSECTVDYTILYTDGSESKTGAKVAFKEESDPFIPSLDEYGGLKWPENDTADERIAKVWVSVLVGKKSDTRTAQCTQLGKPTE